MTGWKKRKIADAQSVAISDTSPERVAEIQKQRHEPVAWLPPDPPPECKTEAEKTAFAFGWWKALDAQRKPLTDEQWQVIADTLDCLITRKQKDAIEAVIGIKENT